MREMLSRTPDSENPAPASVNYELSLEDCPSQCGRLYRVTMARARLQDSDEKAVWDGRTTISFLTLQEAEYWYAEWRLLLKQLGFTDSIMDS